MVWQISDGTIVRQFDDLAESVAFSPDGKILVSGSGQNDPYIRLRSVEDWSLLSVFDGPAFSLDFSPDGTLLATSDSSAISILKIGR